MDLCELKEPLRLESLTVGPMGQANLNIDGTPILSRSPPVGDPSVARGVFQGIQAQPAVLRVDTFPVYPSPVFSTRLATFHFFGGNYLAEYPNTAEWYKILSAAPNLVELRLWHPRHGDTTSLPCGNSVNLPLLKRLDLTGLFVQLCGLFTQFPLPNLTSLLLDSLDPHTNIPQQVTDVALVAPRLEHLSIGSMVFNSKSASGRWARPLRTLGSLQTITFIEAEWEEISTALEQLELTPGKAVHVRLERIHDVIFEELERFEVEGNRICSTELVDCVEGARCRSIHDGSNFSESEQGSNYSDGSSISYIYEVTSEESGPEEYEYSSAEDWYSSESDSGDEEN
ncbi:hypothetical protein FRC09_000861 [Ceratobasidium sp. 395]|nr:hypothetical protein FRC09_000861 [Ceratobasidium sp. 395]